MKSLPANFEAKITALYGQKPIVMAEISYNDGTDKTLYVATRRKYISTGHPAAPVTFNEYLSRVLDYNCGVTEDDALCFVTSITLEITRNATTETLLSSVILQKPVKIYLQFFDLGWGNQLEFANLIVGDISDIKPGSFNLNLVANEISMEQIPKLLLNKTDYSKMPDDYIGLPKPFFLGDCSCQSFLSTWEKIAYLLHYKSILAPAVCVDKGISAASGPIFLVYSDPSFDVPAQTVYAFCWISEWRTLGQLLKADETANFTTTRDTSGHRLYITLNQSGTTDYGDFCIPRIVPDYVDHANNVCATVNNAIDLDSDTVATLDVTNTDLVVGFSDRYQGGKTFQTHFQGHDLQVAMNVVSNSGQITIYASADKGNTWVSLGTETGTGYIEKYFDDALLVADYDLRNIRIKIVRNSGTITIDGLHIRFMLQIEDMSVNPPNTYLPTTIFAHGRKIEGGRIYNSAGGQTTWKYKGNEALRPEWMPAMTKMFLHCKSTDYDLSGLTWSYKHPIYILYYIMEMVIGGSCNVPNFNTIYGRLNSLAGSSWSMNYVFESRKDPMAVINEICQMCGLKLWQGYDGVYRLFIVNYPESSTLTFSDGADGTDDKYGIKDFEFGYLENFYNKLEIHWKKNWASGEFAESYMQDHSTDADLDNSWDAHNSKENYFPISECAFVNDLVTLGYCFTMLKKWIGAKRRWVKFRCGSIGCKLDPGDTILVNHRRDNWSDNAIKFQVYSIRMPETVPIYEIYAVELVT